MKCRKREVEITHLLPAFFWRKRILLVDCLFTGQQCIFHQGHDSHRTYTTRYGGYEGTFRRHFIEFNVACQFEARFLGGIRHAGSPYVNDYSPLFHHFCFHKIGLPESCNDDIGFLAFFNQVLAAAMAYGYRRIARKSLFDSASTVQVCHWELPIRNRATLWTCVLH